MRILLVLLLSYNVALGQDTIIFKVLDIRTHKPIKGAVVEALSRSTEFISDSLGEIKVKPHHTLHDSYMVTHDKYLLELFFLDDKEIMKDGILFLIPAKGSTRKERRKYLNVI